MSKKSICVFCGASEMAENHYFALARKTGREMARRNYRLVYGGGGVGLMGACASAARDAGGDVLGIIPKFLTEIEAQLEGIKQIIVDDMRTRKQLMLENSDAFIVLPGGIGTLEEAIEILSWLRLHLHSKPMVFVDNNGYWQPLMQALHHTIQKGFAPEWLKAHLLYRKTPVSAVNLIERQWNNPPKKGKLKPHADIDKF